MKKFFLFFVFIALFILFAGTGTLMAISLDFKMLSSANSGVSEAMSAPQDKDHGIGPIKSVELGSLNNKMINEGKGIFNNQCIVCHEMDQKKLGPPLRNVTKERTPEYIMNLLLNSAQMQKEDPKVKELLKQYNNLPMPDPALNQSKARSVLEYLRSMAK